MFSSSMIRATRTILELPKISSVVQGDSKDERLVLLQVNSDGESMSAVPQVGFMVE